MWTQLLRCAAGAQVHKAWFISWFLWPRKCGMSRAQGADLFLAFSLPYPLHWFLESAESSFFSAGMIHYEFEIVFSVVFDVHGLFECCSLSVGRFRHFWGGRPQGRLVQLFFSVHLGRKSTLRGHPSPQNVDKVIMNHHKQLLKMLLILFIGSRCCLSFVKYIKKYFRFAVLVASDSPKKRLHPSLNTRLGSDGSASPWKLQGLAWLLVCPMHTWWSP